jgi:type IV pilus assembly protein PilV
MNLSRQNGFSMVEVLVTMVILAIGLLGTAGLQIASVRNTQIAAQRSIATQQAYDIAERIRANMGRPVASGGAPGGAVNGSYDALDASTPAAPVCNPCTPVEQAVADHAAWNAANARALPNGSGTVAGSWIAGYTVTLNWDEPNAPGQLFRTVVHP